MHASVRALLNQILDYAGLFPPAKLPLSDALRTYLRAKQKSPHQWMLGRFVCPVAQLPELLDLSRGHPESSHLLQVAALGKQADDAKLFVPQVEQDVKAIKSFCTSFGRRDVIDLYEVALPTTKPIATSLFMIPMAAMELGRAALPVFIEIPRIESWREDVDAACGMIGDLRQMNAKAGIGLKLRAGGLTAEAFPGDEQVACFIERCVANQVAWKATAGLHHPRRHWDEVLKVWHHGFLNVFVAGVLAKVHSLNEADIAAILADRDGQHFKFEADRIAWKDWTCSTAQIATCRSGVATTFGSCSFEEPCEELGTMGLLESK
jgi:hypothetical protein